jgi:3-oxoacyl-(acyl-carrier-protein) synthase/aryl carrier-like protein
MSPVSDVPVVSSDHLVPASSEQLDVWLAAQREGQQGRYNVPLVLEFAGPVDIAALRAALRDLAHRHPALRGRFAVLDGDLTLVVSAEPRLVFVDRPTVAPQAESARWAAADELSGRPLDPGVMLVRSDLLRSPDHVLLIVTIHHLVADAWSVDVLARELMAAYTSGVSSDPTEPAPVRRPPPPKPRLAAGGPADDAYWWDLLHPPGWSWLLPPHDFVDAGSGPSRPAGAERALPSHALAGVRSIAQRLRVSPALTVFAAWAMLTHAWSAEADGVLGMAFSGRDEESHDEVGLYTRVLPVRSRWLPADTFAHFATSLRGQVLDSVDHSLLPAERLREIRNLQGDSAGRPRCVFLHQGESDAAWTIGETTVQRVERVTPTAKYDMTLAVIEGRDRLRLVLDYDAERYRPETAEVLLAQLDALLEVIVAGPGHTCQRLLTALGQAVRRPGVAAPSFLDAEPTDVVVQLSTAASAVDFAAACSRDHGVALAHVDVPSLPDLRRIAAELVRQKVTVAFLPTELLMRVVREAPELLQAVRQTRFFGPPAPVAMLNTALEWSGTGGLKYGHTAGPDDRLLAVWDVTPLDLRSRAVLGLPVSDAGIRAWFADASVPAAGVAGHLVADQTQPTRYGQLVRWSAAGLVELIPDADPLRVADTADAPHVHAGTALPVAAVRAAWLEVLGDRQFGDDENFFDVGGNSLLILRLQRALRIRTGRTIELAELFRHTTVRAQSGATGTAMVRRPAAAAERRDSGAPAAWDDIAVIGMACRFANSPDLDAFWNNLRYGRDCLTTGPGAVVTQLPNGARRVRRWGLIAEGPVFDAEFFGFAASQTASVDPRHGVLYESLWSAVEDAALKISVIGPRTSLFVGRDRWSEHFDPGTDEAPTRADDVVGCNGTFLPSWFSYWVDLQGESLLLDTACSTSLVAVHLACRSLQHGDCEYALAGGASIENPQHGSYTAVPGHIYSRDGYCRPFDRAATGTVGGDGAGAVLLRRLGDARRDGDPIYAVIRGSAVNNDGSARVGYSAPGVEGQVRVIRRALEASRVSAAEVDFVEPHGTGTRLGDAIEATALVEALGPNGPAVAIGGLKASIGHTNSASGVAGLIKTVLAVHHGFLPATPHVETPIEELTGGRRFTLLPEGKPWQDTGRPRTAGVSSFGVGGTNAHVIVQQAAERC